MEHINFDHLAENIRKIFPINLHSMNWTAVIIAIMCRASINLTSISIQNIWLWWRWHFKSNRNNFNRNLQSTPLLVSNLLFTTLTMPVTPTTPATTAFSANNWNLWNSPSCHCENFSQYQMPMNIKHLQMCWCKSEPIACQTFWIWFEYIGWYVDSTLVGEYTQNQWFSTANFECETTLKLCHIVRNCIAYFVHDMRFTIISIVWMECPR